MKKISFIPEMQTMLHSISKRFEDVAFTVVRLVNAENGMSPSTIERTCKAAKKLIAQRVCNLILKMTLEQDHET